MSAEVAQKFNFVVLVRRLGLSQIHRNRDLLA